MNQWSLKKKLSFSLLTIIILLSIVEGIFRLVFWWGTREYHTSVYIQGNTLQMDDPVLVFRNRPFYLDKNKKFQYNEYGMKSAPGDVFVPAKDTMEFRVLLLGASTMEGMGSNKDGAWLDITGINDHPYHETIAWFLEKKLQKKMPLRKVKVFNGANSSFNLEQNLLHYQQLADKIRPDWVISLDGQNELTALTDTADVMEIVRKDWTNNPTKKFPLTWIIPLTSHSAFINFIKQSFFEYNSNKRITNQVEKQYPVRNFWLNSSSRPLLYKEDNPPTQKAIDHFYERWLAFDSILTTARIPHLLYIQPNLIFRDTLLMSVTEKALLHYYQHEHNDPEKNSFLKGLRTAFVDRATGHPQLGLLDFTDQATYAVFLDYCHFTKEANQEVAGFLADKISGKDNTRVIKDK